MSTPTTKTDKLLTLWRRGIATDKEVIDAFLFNIADVEDIKLVQILVRNLPSELTVCLRKYLEELRAKDFQWHPLVIGAEFSEAELQQLRAKLIQLYPGLSG